MSVKKIVGIFVALFIILSIPFVIRFLVYEAHNEAAVQAITSTQWNGQYALSSTDELDGQIMGDSINYDNTGVILNTYVFNKVGGYGFSSQQLLRILSNGNKSSPYYQPLKPEMCGGIDEQEQLEVYADYMKYYVVQKSDIYKSKNAYLGALDAYYASKHSVLDNRFKGKYGALDPNKVGALPPEVLRIVLQEYEESGQR